MGSAPDEADREWYGVSETASMLGVTRQTVHERVGKLQGAELVGGRWRIPARVVEALLTAERAKALASGSLVVLPTGVAPDEKMAASEASDLAGRVSELERAVLEQSRTFTQQLAERDDLIAELRAERRRLRQALGALTQGLSHLIGDDD